MQDAYETYERDTDFQLPSKLRVSQVQLLKNGRSDRKKMRGFAFDINMPGVQHFLLFSASTVS